MLDIARWLQYYGAELVLGTAVSVLGAPQNCIANSSTRAIGVSSYTRSLTRSAQGVQTNYYSEGKGTSSQTIHEVGVCYDSATVNSGLAINY